MLLSDVFIVLLLCGCAWLWWIDRGIKQLAYRKCKSLCEQQDVQLLDDNIYIKKLSLKKNKKGLLQVYRHFEFEFTSTNEQRYKGKLEMSGRSVIHFELAPHRI